MEEEKCDIPITRDTKVTFSKEWNMERENITTWKANFTLEIGFKIKSMEMVNIFTRMEIFTQVNFKTTWRMEKVVSNRQTKTTTKVLLKLKIGEFYMNNKDKRGIYYDAINQKKIEFVYDKGKIISQE